LYLCPISEAKNEVVRQINAWVDLFPFLNNFVLTNFM